MELVSQNSNMNPPKSKSNVEVSHPFQNTNSNIISFDEYNHNQSDIMKKLSTIKGNPSVMNSIQDFGNMNINDQEEINYVVSKNNRQVDNFNVVNSTKHGGSSASNFNKPDVNININSSNYNFYNPPSSNIGNQNLPPINMMNQIPNQYQQYNSYQPMMNQYPPQYQQTPYFPSNIPTNYPVYSQPYYQNNQNPYTNQNQLPNSKMHKYLDNNIDDVNYYNDVSYSYYYQDVDDEGNIYNRDEDFINRNKNLIADDDGIKDEDFLDGFSAEDFILKDEETMLRNSIKQDISILNEIKSQLEKELGKNVFREVYRVVKEKSQTQQFSYDICELTYHIFNELPEFKQEILNLACNKIPEFYSLIYTESLQKEKGIQLKN